VIWWRLAGVEFSTLDAEESCTMNFTGERYIPGEGGCQIAYEHLHRYFFALRWAGGLRGSGSGLRKWLWSGTTGAPGASRPALDIDGETVALARKSWCHPKLDLYARGRHAIAISKRHD